MRKKDLSLIFGLSIPFLMIIFVALSIHVPKILAEDPQYDFLYYLTEDNFNSDKNESYYTVRKGLINFVDNNPQENFQERSIIFRHDVSENKSYEVSFDEVRFVELKPSFQSPDGYELVNSYGGDILYFDIGYDKLFLKGYNVSSKMNIFNSNVYFNKFNFLGWIYE